MKRGIIGDVVLSGTKVLEYDNRSDSDRSENKSSLVDGVLS